MDASFWLALVGAVLAGVGVLQTYLLRKPKPKEDGQDGQEDDEGGPGYQEAGQAEIVRAVDGLSEATRQGLTEVARASTVTRRESAENFARIHESLAKLSRWGFLALGVTLLSFAMSHCNARGQSVSPVSGDDQTATAGQPLPEPVVVQVRRTNSEPVKGATVFFAPSNRHGTASPVAVVTDSTGEAQTYWTLGRDPGNQALLATTSNESAWITATAEREPPVPVGISISPGSALLEFVGDTVRFSATVVDQYGDPFPAAVAWSSKRQCVFRAGSGGLATALAIGTDSIVAVSGSLRATAPVTVEIGGGDSG